MSLIEAFKKATSQNTPGNTLIDQITARLNARQDSKQAKEALEKQQAKDKKVSNDTEPKPALATKKPAVKKVVVNKKPATK